MPFRLAQLISPPKVVCCALLLGAAAFGQQPTLAPPLGSEGLIELPSEAEVEVTGEAAVPVDAVIDRTPADELRSELRRHHRWASFEVGAWRRSRTVSEAFDAAGDFAGRSLTERTDRLAAVDANSYTIETDTVVSLAGLNRPEPTETQRYGLLTDRPYHSEAPNVTRGEVTSVSLNGLALPCRQWSVSYAEEGRGEEDLLYLAEDGPPVVLRKERQAVGEQATRSVTRVTRLRTPGLFGQQLTPVWHATTTVTRPDGSRSEAFSVHSGEAPGGLHTEAVTEYDASGRRLRWAVTTVVVAGATPDNQAALGGGEDGPAVSIEVRPRRFLRMLRRDQRRDPEP